MVKCSFYILFNTIRYLLLKLIVIILSNGIKLILIISALSLFLKLKPCQNSIYLGYLPSIHIFYRNLSFEEPSPAGFLSELLNLFKYCVEYAHMLKHFWMVVVYRLETFDFFPTIKIIILEILVLLTPLTF